MADLSGIPFFEVQFDKEGKVHQQSEERALADFLDQGGTTDLFVVSHGWNNDMGEARELYSKLFQSIADRLRQEPLPAREFAVLGVFWPSKKLADRSLIAGGAASGGSLADSVLREQLERLKGGFDGAGADAALERAKGVLDSLEFSPQAQRDYVKEIRSLVRKTEKQPDVDGVDSFFTEDAERLMQDLSRPVPRRASTHADEGGAADATSQEGGAAGLIDSLGGIKDGALNLLNYATYYQMKERAGMIGEVGLNPLLARLRARQPAVRLHLIGHSFGGRLVTATAAGKASDTQPAADTMTLLQAAFSHNGFASHFDGNRDGFFRRVITKSKVSGPIIVTHSQNDRAVGKLYPLASMFVGQDASGIGGPASPFGGIGCNGAQCTPEAIQIELLEAGGRYPFAAGKLYNLKSDVFIGDHSDVCGRQVAAAILAAVAVS